MTEPAALVVADDLTGAADTGNEFAQRGYETVVVFEADGADSPAADVLVVDTDSRYLAPDEAADRVANAVADHPAALVYKKVDSTLRGNLVAEIDAAIRTREADLAVVAPAFPANGRVTACGQHLVDGELVAATAAGRDPDAPVATSHIPSLLAASDFRVSTLPIETVASGAEAVTQALVETHRAADGPVVVVGDATHDRHLAAIGNGTADTDRPTVFVGSAGLARHVPIPPVETGTTGTPRQRGGDESRPTRVLGVAGSASPVTLEQVAAVPTDQVRQLDAAMAATDPERAARSAAAACEAAYGDSSTVLLASATAEGDVQEAVAAGREAGVPEEQVRERVARALGHAVEQLHDEAPLSGLFLTGGAVAGAVLGTLGADGVRLTGRAVEDGVPVGEVVGGRADGLPVVTKAGAFGETTTVNASLAHLRGENGR